MVMIGRQPVPNPVWAAPLAGYTSRAFRDLAREAGCGLACTEMVSATALAMGCQSTRKLIDIAGEPPPVAVQLFGSQPGVMAKAAAVAEQSGASIIDLNFGCPAPKVLKNGEGAALMRDPGRVGEIVRSVVKAVTVPVTAKIRKGWDDELVNAVEVARAAEDAGAAAITVHGRTCRQLYSGKADWEIIRQVKRSVGVPVVGNGDIWQPEDALRMMEQTGCDAVMIGRGALGNPWIFSRTLTLLETGETPPPPSLDERAAMALRHLQMEVAARGEVWAVHEMRKHLIWYFKGYPGASVLRDKLVRAGRMSEVEDLVARFLDGQS